jgi:hypothetical protein
MYTSPQIQQSLLGGGYRAPRSAGPNYADLIAGDWEVQFAQGQSEAQLARARAAYRKSLNQQLIDLGLTDTSRIGGLGQYIDPETVTRAAENKYSSMARISQEEARAKAQSNAALAARGILTSGQTTKNTEDIIAGAEGSRYSALRDFLAGGEQGLQGISELEDQMAWQVAQARAAAANRAAQTYRWWEEEPDYRYPETGRTQGLVGGTLESQRGLLGPGGSPGTPTPTRVTRNPTWDPLRTARRPVGWRPF